MRKFKQQPETKATNPALESIKRVISKEWQVWKKLLATRLSDIPGNHKAIGKNFLEQGLYKEAIYRFKFIRWMRPGDAETIGLMAIAYTHLKETAKAKEALLELKTKHANYPDIAHVEAQIREILSPKKPAASEAADEPITEDTPTTAGDS